MVLNKISEDTQFFITQNSAPVLEQRSEWIHWTLVEESIPSSEEHRVIKDCIHALSVSSYIAHISIENFSNSINSSWFAKFAPKPLRNFRNSIDSQPIDFVLRNWIFNPSQKSIFNPIVLLFNIGKASKSTILNVIHIFSGKIFVRDDAIIMEVLGAIKGHIVLKILS